MKRWLFAAAAVAVAIALAGCPNGGGGREPDLPPVATRLGLEVTTSESWSGFDLVHAPHPGGEHDYPVFDFQAGDTIEIEGRMVRGTGRVGINLNQGGENWLYGWRSALTGEFESGPLVMDADDVAAMAGSDHAHAARVRADAAGTVFVVEYLTVRRGDEVLFDLVAHLETLTIGETDRDVIFGAGPEREIPLQSAGGPAAVSFRVVGPGAAPAPSITTHPSNRRIPIGTPAADIAALTVVAAEAPDGVTQSFQWYAQGTGGTWTAISGATTASLPLAERINNATAEGSWTFRVAVTNTLGGATASINSNAATITVYDPEGMDIRFSLTEWLADNTTLGHGSRPLQAGAGPPVVYTVDATGITVTGRANNWDSVDLWIDEANLDLDVENFMYQVRVEGNVIGAPGGTQVSVGRAEAPWSGLANQGGLEGNAAFGFSAIIPADYRTGPEGADQPQDRLRIQTNNTTDFRITELVIERLGDWPEPAPPPASVSIATYPTAGITEVQVGGTLTFRATVLPGDAEQYVTWGITTTPAPEGVSINTTTGVLTVAADAALGAVAVRATTVATPARQADVTVTVIPVPDFGITLSVTANHPFPPQQEGYSAVTPLTVKVTNTGNQPTGALTVALSDTDAASFEISANQIPAAGLAAGAYATFGVGPVLGLTVGTHTATVTVSGGTDATAVSASFTVSMIVSDEPIIPPYSVTVTAAGNATSVTRGTPPGTLVFTAVVSAEDPADTVTDSSVTWSVTPDRGVELAADGLSATLTVPADAVLGNLTVRATSVDDGVYGEATVEVVAPALSSITIAADGDATTVPQDGTLQFSITAIGPAGAEMPAAASVTWAVTPNANVTIPAGLLTVGANVAGGTELSITAAVGAVTSTPVVVTVLQAGTLGDFIEIVGQTPTPDWASIVVVEGATIPGDGIGPLRNAGGGTRTWVAEGDGLALHLTGRANPWYALDVLVTGADSLGLDIGTYQYTVTVEGRVLANTGGDILIRSHSGPPANSEGTIIPDSREAFPAVGETFTVGGIIQDRDGMPRIRIQSDTAGQAVNFAITSIRFERGAEWPAIDERFVFPLPGGHAEVFRMNGMASLQGAGPTPTVTPNGEVHMPSTAGWHGIDIPFTVSSGIQEGDRIQIRIRNAAEVAGQWLVQHARAGWAPLAEAYNLAVGAEANLDFVVAAENLLDPDDPQSGPEAFRIRSNAAYRPFYVVDILISRSQ